MVKSVQCLCKSRSPESASGDKENEGKVEIDAVKLLQRANDVLSNWKPNIVKSESEDFSCLANYLTISRD